jgi:hypothetical protein
MKNKTDKIFWGIFIFIVVVIVIFSILIFLKIRSTPMEKFGKVQFPAGTISNGGAAGFTPGWTRASFSGLLFRHNAAT